MPFAAAQSHLTLDYRSPAIPVRLVVRLDAEPDTAASQFAVRLARVVVEVGNGARAPHQLVRWSTPEVHAALVRRGEALRRTLGHGEQRRVRAVLRSVHVSSPRDGVGEVAMHLSRGPRSLAVAARVELVGDRWICTALAWG